MRPFFPGVFCSYTGVLFPFTRTPSHMIMAIVSGIQEVGGDFSGFLPPSHQSQQGIHSEESVVQPASSHMTRVDEAALAMALDRGYKFDPTPDIDDHPEDMRGVFVDEAQLVQQVTFPMPKQIKDCVVSRAVGNGNSKLLTPLL